MDAIPDDFILDVHDFAAILLATHARTESLFPSARLVEINCGDTPLLTLPTHILPPAWHAAALTQKRVAYILKTDPCPPPPAEQAPARVAFDTFASPAGVRTPSGAPPTRRALEDAFWRCKTYDAGYVLAYAAQRVFDRLPPTARLRARTSARHTVLCAPADVTVAEIDVAPHEACLILDHTPRPDLGPAHVDLTQHRSGFGGAPDPMPWVFLLLGEARSEDMAEDPRAVLDLATAQLGGRGGGGEVFALERAFDYHGKVLPKVAQEGERYVLSGKLRITPEAIRARGDALVDAVMERVCRLAGGQDDFCRYCGREGVNTRCSKCKKARFCQECVTQGWKYHKVWCPTAS